MDTGNIPAETAAIFGMFFDGTPVSCRTVSTGGDADDFRETLITETASGGRYVIKLAENDFTCPEKIAMRQRTADLCIAGRPERRKYPCR